MPDSKEGQQSPEKYSDEWWAEEVTIAEFIPDWVEWHIEELKKKDVLPEDYTLPADSLDDFRTKLTVEDIRKLPNCSEDSKECFEVSYNLLRSFINRDGTEFDYDGKEVKSLDIVYKRRYIVDNAILDDMWWREAQCLSPEWREELLPGDQYFSHHLLAVGAPVADVLNEKKQKAAAKSLDPNDSFWNSYGSKWRKSKQYAQHYRKLQFHATQKFVSYFEQQVALLLKEKGTNLSPKAFDTPEFTMLQAIMPWMQRDILSWLCSKGTVQPDSTDHIWFQEAHNLSEEGLQKMLQNVGMNQEEIQKLNHDQKAERYATTLAEHRYKARGFLDCCKQACPPSGSINLRAIAGVAAYWHQFITSEKENIFDRIPSEKDMGCRLKYFPSDCKDGVLKDFDYTEIDKLEQELRRVCKNDSPNQDRLKFYASQGILFQRIQIKKQENGHLRATVADSLYQDFGLTSPQQQKAKLKPMGTLPKPESKPVGTSPKPESKPMGM